MVRDGCVRPSRYTTTKQSKVTKNLHFFISNPQKTTNGMRVSKSEEPKVIQF